MLTTQMPSSFFTNSLEVSPFHTIKFDVDAILDGSNKIQTMRNYVLFNIWRTTEHIVMNKPHYGIFEETYKGHCIWVK